jgi:transposase-like protein
MIMAMIILGLKFSQTKTTERTIAMHKKKVRKENDQVKLFLDPSLVSRGFDIEHLIQELQLEVQALGVSAGTLLVQKIIEADVSQLVGKRYERDDQKHYVWGKQDGFSMLGGQKVHIEHTRVRRGRRGKGSEVVPESYERFQEDTDRTRRVFANLLASVSCRQYQKAIETVQEGYGISKSVVNREMIEATSEQLTKLCERRLDGVDLLVLVIDGIEVDGTVFISALGVDRQGVKHLLGFVEGATENSDACVELLEDLKDRGLKMGAGSVLAILDGSKALHKAVKDFFGKKVLIHRCHEHKIRNVKSHLPKKYHSEIERKLRAAYKMNDYQEALSALQGVLRYLEQKNESAARSLEEGMEETLTIHKLGLPDILRKSLSSTNMIESTYSRYRHVTRNVKRWKSVEQKKRWAATALLEAERSFRRIKGFKSISVLVAALDAQLEMANDQTSQAA